MVEILNSEMMPSSVNIAPSVESGNIMTVALINATLDGAAAAKQTTLESF